MQRSTYISAGGHAILMGFALFGGVFNAEPLELPSLDISVVSAEEFAALTTAPQPPEVQREIPQLADPVAEPDLIPLEPTADPEPQRPEPPRVPDALPQPEPQPVAPVAPVAPNPPEPADDPAPPAQDVVVIPDLAPDASVRPKPRPADRVASEAVAAPDPIAEIDNRAQEQTTPDEAAETPLPEQDETAPEEATTEIVTEAEIPASSAPGAVPRPRARPTRPAQTQTATAAESAPSVSSDAVNAALAEALGQPAAPAGPALSQGEINTLTAAIRDCWAVDIGNPAMSVVLDVYFKFDAQGRVVSGTLRLHEFIEGNADAIDTAFQFARRAIFRCQRDGYPTLAAKFGTHDEIIVRFNPERMRLQ